MNDKPLDPQMSEVDGLNCPITEGREEEGKVELNQLNRYSKRLGVL